jgi:hypothetical protein
MDYIGGDHYMRATARRAHGHRHGGPKIGRPTLLIFSRTISVGRGDQFHEEGEIDQT